MASTAMGSMSAARRRRYQATSTATRFLYQPQDGHTVCGVLAWPQRGHTLTGRGGEPPGTGAGAACLRLRLLLLGNGHRASPENEFGLSTDYRRMAADPHARVQPSRVRGRCRPLQLVEDGPAVVDGPRAVAVARADAHGRRRRPGTARRSRRGTAGASATASRTSARTIGREIDLALLDGERVGSTRRRRSDPPRRSARRRRRRSVSASGLRQRRHCPTMPRRCCPVDDDVVDRRLQSMSTVTAPDQARVVDVDVGQRHGQSRWAASLAGGPARWC